MSRATFPEKHKGLRFSRTVLRKGIFGEKRKKGRRGNPSAFTAALALFSISSRSQEMRDSFSLTAASRSVLFAISLSASLMLFSKLSIKEIFKSSLFFV